MFPATKVIMRPSTVHRSQLFVLVLTLGCMTAVVGDFRGNDLGIVVLCGSPTLLLGGLFLWLGVRRLKR